jgi:hypothetical protein
MGMVNPDYDVHMRIGAAFLVLLFGMLSPMKSLTIVVVRNVLELSGDVSVAL